MRRIVIAGSCLVFVLASCGSDKKEATPPTTTSPASAATTTTTSAPVTSTSSVITTTTSAECPDTGTTSLQSTLPSQPAALLTKVGVTTVACRDTVTFTFKKSGSAVPSCKIEYKPGPFTKDGSGQPVAVEGTAFVTVRCEPAYGYDFATGTPTYTGAKRITPTGAKHVREVVETGDFEGVLNWVIGVDVKRGYGIASGGVPERRLTITFS
jgi:hypothetical protein